MFKHEIENKAFSYLGISFFFVLFLFAYSATLKEIHEYWSNMDNAYAHGYMVLGVAIYLLYNSKNKIFLLNQAVTLQYFLLTLTVMSSFSILWFSAYSTQVQIIQFISLIFLIWLWIGAVFGKTALIKTTIPVGLFLMAIPIWDMSSVYLQALTVFISQFFLRLFSITAFFEGNFIHLPYGIIEIAESCSGLKYFLAGTTLGIIYSELNLINIYRKIGVTLLAVVISVIANWIRVFSLTLIADISKMEHPLVRDHDNFGWIIFIICFVIFLLIANKIGPGTNSVKKDEQNLSLPKEAVKFTNILFLRVLLSTLLVVILPVVSWLVVNDSGVVSLSHQLQSKNARKISNPDWLPGYSGFDEVNSWKVMDKGRDFEITVVTYLDQRQGKEMIYYRNKLNASNYNLKNLDGFETPEGLSMNMSVIGYKSNQRLVGWYYKIGSYHSNDKYMAKLLQIPAILKGLPISSLVTFSTPCNSLDCSNEVTQVISSEFFASLMSSIKINKGIESQ